MRTLSAWLAIVFGVALAIGEAARNWGDWQWWPFWVVDYICVALLIAGAASALRGGAGRLLAGGWGFTAGVFWMAFFSHLETRAPGDEQLTAIIGAMLALAALGFALALPRNRNG